MPTFFKRIAKDNTPKNKLEFAVSNYFKKSDKVILTLEQLLKIQSELDSELLEISEQHPKCNPKSVLPFWQTEINGDVSLFIGNLIFIHFYKINNETYNY